MKLNVSFYASIMPKMSSYQKHVKMVEIEKARFEAADRIMRLLAEYRAISSLEQFKYLHIS